ncbi:MAG: DUF4383 domain-containing protein [Pseudonocardiaceae bacterium]
MVNKVIGMIFGAVYVVVGLVGFAVTGSTGFASMEGGLLLGLFEVNPLHNIVHVLVGALLLIGGFAAAQVAKTVNTTVGAVYLVVGALGLAVHGSALNILALNYPDHLLHFASAALLLAVGLAADRSPARVAR